MSITLHRSAAAVASRLVLFGLAACLGVFVGGASARAADAELWTRRDAAVARGVEFLAKAQSPEGAFTPQAGPAITSLVTMGLLQNGRTPDDPMVAKALAYLEKFVQKDGGIYSPGSDYLNYETCITLQA